MVIEIPIFQLVQYSTTPKPLNLFTSRAIELEPDPEAQVFYGQINSGASVPARRPCSLIGFLLLGYDRFTGWSPPNLPSSETLAPALWLE